MPNKEKTGRPSPSGRQYALLLCLFLLALPLLLLRLRKEEQGVSPLRSPGTLVSNSVLSAKEKALGELAVIRKVYKIPEGTLAPAPDPMGYGVVYTAEEVLSLFEQAEALLDGRTPIFNAETAFLPDWGIRYYCDESILALVWHEEEPDRLAILRHYTLSEVFLSDASQFRRKLSDDVFGVDALKFPTDMALSSNAVLACSGDFYRFRNVGMCVYDGVLYRLHAEKVDTCAIDDRGNLLFIPAGTLNTVKEAEDYIQENHVRFTLSFGPIMIENHQIVTNTRYSLGEANQFYPRCALAQDGELHYFIALLKNQADIRSMTDFVMKRGVERCYALDGGQTGTIVLDNSVQNPSIYGAGDGVQRTMSDIIYFATAIPETERGH